MKKLLSFALALILSISLAACGNSGEKGSGAPASDKVEGAVSDLLAAVVKDATDPELSLVEPEINDENFTWYFFIDPIEGAEAAVSEPMIGSIAHFVGLLRVPEGTDPETVRADIEEKLDPRKWVCVEAETTAVIRRGDLILVAMSEKAVVDKVTENFNAL